MKKQINKMNSNALATFLGLVVAIATACLTIDFKYFELTAEWPKLVCVILIAAGGYYSEIKKIK